MIHVLPETHTKNEEQIMKAILVAVVLGLGIVAATAAPVANGVTTIEEVKYPNNPDWAQKAFEGGGSGG